jgi:hypothetical protein
MSNIEQAHRVVDRRNYLRSSAPLLPDPMALSSINITALILVHTIPEFGRVSWGKDCSTLAFLSGMPS